MRNSDIAKIRKLDFNLLKTLSVLLEHKHISESAELLFLSQPAVSKQLTKLRSMFNDPLLVRSGNTQLLTPKAERIKPKVHSLCEQVKQLVIPDELNLREVKVTVSIMFSDYGSPHWISKLLRELHNEAPNVTIICKEWSKENIKQLIKGELNIALGPILDSNQCESIKLGVVTTSFIARKNHPLFSENTDIPPFSNFPIIRISGSTQYQHIYSAILPDNPIMLDQASMWLALDTLKYSDAILIGPTPVMYDLARAEEFQCMHLKQVPNIDVCMSWTSGLTNDLFYKWLIDKMIRIGNEIIS
ncbi:LysR family transcriptional regulator [Aliivibrio fischeri]|uniref:LysR family transcriptional regulator n=1 Tax=Aliivibrio fischeri TaxID=668 RepID=UPI0012DA6A1F|nr:LysR family transcriptional regulator [Aliivibrio fischeri]MUK68322.1 LysR family transcriptional regulator [Aliivibrio fischeri]MUK73814.1 LysR family transcriptional regulator [Aliivibrio fischeri]